MPITPTHGNPKVILWILADLKAAPRQVTCPHAPVPFAPVLEDAYVPTAARIEEAARAALGERATAAAG